MDNIFEILGIESTMDKEKIRSAYMSRLAVTNPEDDPEGFKRLRQAYDEAISLSDKKEDTSPVGMWLDRVKECYFDMGRRCDRWCWEELLEDEVCTDIGTFTDARNALLGFLYDCCFLPNEIFELIADRFNIEEDREELEQDWPRGYIAFILRGGNGIRVDLIDTEDGKLADRVCELWLSYLRAKGEGDKETTEEIMEKYIATGVRLPSFEVDLAVEYARNGEHDKAKKILDELTNIAECEGYVLAGCAEAYMEMGDKEKSLALCDIVEKKYPGNLKYRLLRLSAKESEGEYLAAKKGYEELYNENSTQEIFEHLQRVNEKIISEMTPHNTEEKIELGWCYYQNEMNDKLMELMDSFLPENEKDLAMYYNLRSRALMIAERYGEARECIGKWRNELNRQICHNEKEENDRRRRIVLSAFFLARCLRCMAATEKNDALLHEALEATNESIVCGEQNVMLQLYLERSYILCELKKYDEASDLCSIIVDRDEYCIPAYFIRQEANFELRRPEAVFEDYHRLINMVPDLQLPKPYAIAANVYVIYGRYKDALEIIKLADENGAKSDYIEYVRASALRYLATKENETRRSLNILLEITAKPSDERIDINNERLIDIYEEICFAYMDLKEWDEAEAAIDKLAGLEENCFDRCRIKLDIYRKSGKFKDASATIKALEKQYPDNPFVLYEKAKLVENEGSSAAIRIYKKILKLDPDYRDTLLRLKEIYHRKYNDKFKSVDLRQATYYADLSVERYKSATAYISRGVLYVGIGELDKAEVDFRQAMDIEPENTVAIEWLGDVLRISQRHDEALTFYEEAYDISGSEKGYYPIFDFAVGCEAAKKYDRAVEMLTELTQLYPDEIQPWQRLAEVYNKMGKYNLALEIYLKFKRNFALKGERAASVDRSILDIMYKKGNMQQEAYNMVYAAFEKAPKDVSVNLNMARYYCYMAGDYKNTYKYADRAVTYAIKNRYSNEDDLWQALADRTEFIFVLGHYFNLKKFLCLSERTDYLKELKTKRLKNARKDIKYRKMKLYSLAINAYLMGNIKEAVKLFKEMQQGMNCINCSYNYCVEAMVGKAIIAQKNKEYNKACECLEKVLAEEYDIHIIQKILDRIKEKM